MPKTDISDENILNLLQAQPTAEHGFRLLMQKYQEQLYWVVRRMVGEHEDANDVIQNCFIKVFKNIDKFERKSKLYTWMYRIATNEAITFLNQKKRKATNSIEDGEMPLADQLQADESPNGEALELRLQMALEQLPEKQRLVFHLRYYDEQSYDDISQTLGTSVGALKASYHHAVKKIETYFKAIEISEL